MLLSAPLPERLTVAESPDSDGKASDRARIARSPERIDEHDRRLRRRAGQKIHLRILRYNPADPASVPHLQTYELEQTDGMTLFIALNEIREKHRPVAAVRLRLPRRHLRQLRDGDQRPPGPRLPHAHEESSAPRSRWRRCRCSS